jgi:hypothetical protein
MAVVIVWLSALQGCGPRTDPPQSPATTASSRESRPEDLDPTQVERPKLGKTEVENRPNWPSVRWATTARGRGGEPFSFTVLKHMRGTRALGHQETRDVVHEFNDYRTEFIYTEGDGPYCSFRLAADRWGVADGARTHGKVDRRTLAEARLIAPKGPPYQVDSLEVEEYHYGLAGEVTYHGTIAFSAAGSMKSATPIRGKKKRDYYLVWAVDDH